MINRPGLYRPGGFFMVLFVLFMKPAHAKQALSGSMNDPDVVAILPLPCGIKNPAYLK